MNPPDNILVIRFSAFGDVAMTVPVIKELLQQNPQLHITYLSRPAFKELFTGLPRFTFIAADLAGVHKGFTGLFKLHKQLKASVKFSHVADIHDSLRSKILRRLFKFGGTPVTIIDKGRHQKKLLTRYPDKVLKPLKKTVERYADVFREAGLILHLSHQLPEKQPDNTSIFGDKIQAWVGVAPFAKHKGKIYPLNHMEEVLGLLHREQVRVFLFGSREEEATCRDWQNKYNNITNIAGQFTLQQELDLMAQLDVMLSMDSAGMHLASIAGTTVVSVWGATHHYAGFLGYGQSENNIVADDIDCRPCSVYGNKPCFRGDYACLYNISPEQIVGKLKPFF